MTSTGAAQPTSLKTWGSLVIWTANLLGVAVHGIVIWGWRKKVWSPWVAKTKSLLIFLKPFLIYMLCLR